jgi:uncharacterized membrane protein
MSIDANNPVLFEAVIVPHRSLGKTGMRYLVGALTSLSCLVAIGLWFAGAWPAIGFTGLEVTLAVWLLRRHASIEGVSEILLLSDDGLRIIRSQRGSRSEMQVPIGWLRSSLEERPGRAPALMLRGSGVAVEVATSLGESEKRDLASSLGEALVRQRNPVFDNAQLRAPPEE